MNNLLLSSEIVKRDYDCPTCGSMMDDFTILFQGIHIGLNGKCDNCNDAFFFDLEIGHSIYAKLKVNLTKMEIDGTENYLSWYGKRLLNSFSEPDPEDIDITVIKKDQESAKNRTPIVVNCVDPTFTHVLFKSLNLKILRDKFPEAYLIAIIPPNIRWFIPDFVNEIWQVELPLSKLGNYYPKYNDKIQDLLSDYDDYYLSHVVPEPKIKDINDLTGSPPHDFSSNTFRITYVWREDRIWAWDNYHSYKFKKFPFFNPLLWIQKRRVVKLFKNIKKEYPQANFTVAGFGTTFNFPNWIEDQRFDDFTDENHLELCNLYSQSRIVFGIHGADMVLPSAHAGMMFNLVPIFKWDNFAEDIILRDEDPYLSLFRYQFLPASIRPAKLARISTMFLKNRKRYIEHKIEVPEKYN